MPLRALCLLLASTAVFTGCYQQEINDGAARLTIATAGQVAAMVNDDDSCGFGGLSDLLFGVATLAPGADGTVQATWRVDSCRLGGDAVTLVDTDCVGNKTFVQGFAQISASRSVNATLLPPAITASHGVEVELITVDLREFTTFTIARGHKEPDGKLTIHQGRISAHVTPALGAYKDDPTTFGVATPAAHLTRVHLTDAQATLESSDGSVDVDIADTDLSATAGSFDGVRNAIDGTIDIDGDKATIKGDLEPDFDQKAFDASYACDKDLAGPVH